MLLTYVRVVSLLRTPVQLRGVDDDSDRKGDDSSDDEDDVYSSRLKMISWMKCIATEDEVMVHTYVGCIGKRTLSQFRTTPPLSSCNSFLQ